jgi:hypothetical protein
VLNHFQVRHSVRVVYFVREFVKLFVITAFSADDDSSHAVLDGVYIVIVSLVASQRYNLGLLLLPHVSFTIDHTTSHHLDLTVILTPDPKISIAPSAKTNCQLTVVVDLVLLEHGIPSDLLELGMHPCAVN